MRSLRYVFWPGKTPLYRHRLPRPPRWAFVIAQSCSLPWESGICPDGFAMVQRELETWSGELDVFVRIIWLCPENRLASCRKQWPRWRRPGDVTGRRSDVRACVRACVRAWDLGGGAGCSGRGMVLLGMSGKLLFNPSGSLPNAAFWTIWYQELSLSRHCWQFLSPQHTVTNSCHYPLSNRSQELISTVETLRLWAHICPVYWFPLCTSLSEMEFLEPRCKQDSVVWFSLWMDLLHLTWCPPMHLCCWKCLDSIYFSFYWASMLCFLYLFICW